MGRNGKPLVLKVYDSEPVQILVTLVIYSLYAMVLGLALAPSIWLLITLGIPVLSDLHLVRILGFSMVLGFSVWLYFVWGAIWYGTLVRLLTLGFKPGRYPKASLTTLRWLIQSGIQTLAFCTVLPFISVGYFTNLYYKIIGARVGKNVYIRATTVVDAFLLELGDGVILGGNAEISCHIMEPNHLVLQPVVIGDGTLIGAGAYIALGTRVGKNCIVGARCYIRQGITIPDGSVYTVLAGMPMKEALALEKAKAMAKSRGSR